MSKGLKLADLSMDQVVVCLYGGLPKHFTIVGFHDHWVTIEHTKYGRFTVEPSKLELPNFGAIG